MNHWHTCIYFNFPSFSRLKTLSCVIGSNLCLYGCTRNRKSCFHLKFKRNGLRWGILFVGRGRISNTLLHRCPFSRMLTVHAEIRICVRRHVWEHAWRFSFLSKGNWLRKPTPAELLLHAAEFPFFRPSPENGYSPGRLHWTLLYLVPYLMLVRPTSDISLNFLSYIFTEN